MDYINNVGSTHSEVSIDLSFEFWLLPDSLNLWLSAIHIKGSLNAQTYTGSRKYARILNGF